MEERRTEELKIKIMEVLQNVAAGKDKLELAANLAESLHYKLGGSATGVRFSSVFQELHCLMEWEGVEGPLYKLAEKIYRDADYRDREKFSNRRRRN